jgi:hypothetical protein
MSAEPDAKMDEEGLEGERQAASMQEQLSKEVASWSKERRQRSSEIVIKPAQSVTQRRSPRPAGEARKASSPPLAGKPDGARSKPFSMSYDGMAREEYTRYLRDRGSR